jgi:hypothetical protein
MGATCSDNRSERAFQHDQHGKKKFPNDRPNKIKKTKKKVDFKSIKQNKPDPGSEGGEKDINEENNKERERKKMIVCDGNSNNINSIDGKKKYENGKEKESDFNKFHNDSNIINNIINSTIKPYSDLNKDEEYYLLCPDCNGRYPTIKDISYDTKKNDFIISYECYCINNKEIRKSYMINFISIKKPSFDLIFFLSKQMKNKIKDLLEENKNVFEGYQIAQNILAKAVTDMSIAPPPNIIKSNIGLNQKINNSKNIGINQENLNFKESYFKFSNINGLVNKESNLEISENFQINDDFDNLDKNTFKKKYNKSKLSSIKEDKEENCIKYRRKADIKGNNKEILSIIQLESGDIAFGTSDCKIIIWNINKNSLTNQVEDNGRVNCLLEFKNNCLLSGNSINEIFLWDINSNLDCISKFSGHQKSINSLVKCLDNMFASASDDGTIKIWNYEQQKELEITMAHEGAVLCMILLKNGDLCSGSEDKTIKTWDWQKGICKNTIETEENSIRCLYELNDGTLLSGSDEKKIQIWKESKKIKEIDDYQINSLYQINENNFASCSDNIKIWELNNYTCCQILTEHSKNVTGIIKLKDNNLASCSEDTTIIIWTQC